MSVQVYGCNHVAIEVDDVEKAVTFYKDVFNLEQMSGGEGDAFFKLGDHQFLAIFEVDKVQRNAARRSQKETYREIQTQIGAAVPLRLSRSMGESHSSGRSSR